MFRVPCSRSVVAGCCQLHSVATANCCKVVCLNPTRTFLPCSVRTTRDVLCWLPPLARCLPPFALHIPRTLQHVFHGCCTTPGGPAAAPRSGCPTAAAVGWLPPLLSPPTAVSGVCLSQPATACFLPFALRALLSAPRCCSLVAAYYPLPLSNRSCWLVAACRQLPFSVASRRSFACSCPPTAVSPQPLLLVGYSLGGRRRPLLLVSYCRR